MMRRRDLIAMLGGAAVTWPLSARTETISGKRRLAAWIGLTAEARSEFPAFVGRLGALGWAEGRNLEITTRMWNGDTGPMHVQAEELLASRPDVILVVSNPALAILQPMLGGIPTVFVLVADPVGSHFVESLAHPGGTITGFTNFEPSMGGKWVEVLKDTVPTITRVLVLMHPETAAHAAFWHSAEAAAPPLHVEATAAPVHDAAEIERAITDFARTPGGGVVALPHAVTEAHSDLIIALARRDRIPSIFAFAYHVASGALVSYGVNATDLMVRSSDYVDRILRGAKPADLPVQVANKFEFAVNLKTARAIGVTIPPNVLVRADTVIE